MALKKSHSMPLKEMRRGCSIDDCIRLFDVFRCHGSAIHSHLIVGFPGERTTEVDQTIAFMRQNPDIDYYVYLYNDHPGSQSAKRSDKLPVKEIQSRYRAVFEAHEDLLWKHAEKEAKVVGSMTPSANDPGPIVGK